MEKKGFTLVEIIVATVILALVIAGMFVVFKSGERFSVEDKQKTQAENITRQALEILKGQASTSTGFGKLSQIKPDKDLVKQLEDIYEEIVTDQLKDKVKSRDFLCDVKDIFAKEDIDGNGKKDDVVAKKITVTYDWSFWEKGGEQSEKVELSTIVANPNPTVSLPPGGVSSVIPD